MKVLFTNGQMLGKKGVQKKNILVDDGKIEAILAESEALPEGVEIDKTIDCGESLILPGFCDVHVHLREPGFEYKETILSGTMAAAAGGFTTVCTMPNLNPPPVDEESLRKQIDIIVRDAIVKVRPYGAITKDQSGRGELSEMEALSQYVVAFSDDGKGVQDEELMRKAMKKAKVLGRPIVAHCEDESLLDGGYIHDGKYAKEHGHKGISSESEWMQVKRDLALAKETGCPYHVCHVSTKESVELIREAKAKGVDVTCETAPHYLLLCEDNLKENGNYKMNPPLRTKKDQKELIRGIKDGTIDMIATDHAPHSAEEKGKGLEKSAFGIVGLETAFSVLYTGLVMKGIITMEKLVKLIATNPRKRFGIDDGVIEVGGNADFTMVDLKQYRTIEAEKFYSKGASTPFDGQTLQGVVTMTVCDGQVVYRH